MSKTYYIRGTITITVKVEGGKSKVGITPCAGFLSPDKPQKAIAFPLPETKNDSDQIGTALLIGLNKRKVCKFDAEAIKDYMPALLSIAGQQKLVELHLTKIKKKAKQKKNKKKCKIVGFVYPAP